MNRSSDQEKIRLLLRSLAEREPAIYELGTPQLVETEEVNELVRLGPHIIPYLLRLTETETPKVVAYIVMVLNKLRHPETLEPLRRLRADYQARETKTEWDYAVIGQCNLAIQAMEHSER